MVKTLHQIPQKYYLGKFSVKWDNQEFFESGSETFMALLDTVRTVTPTGKGTMHELLSPTCEVSECNVSH